MMCSILYVAVVLLTLPRFFFFFVVLKDEIRLSTHSALFSNFYKHVFLHMTMLKEDYAVRNLFDC